MCIAFNMHVQCKKEMFVSFSHFLSCAFVKIKICNFLQGDSQKHLFVERGQSYFYKIHQTNYCTILYKYDMKIRFLTLTLIRK